MDKRSTNRVILEADRAGAYLGKRITVRWISYRLVKDRIPLAIQTGETGDAFAEVESNVSGWLTHIGQDTHIAELTDTDPSEWVGVWVDGKLAVYVGDTVTIELEDRWGPDRIEWWNRPEWNRLEWDEYIATTTWTATNTTTGPAWGFNPYV